MARSAFSLLFRGWPLRFEGSPSKKGWGSIYPEQYAVLYYPTVEARTPVIAAVYKTAASCEREIRSARYHQWSGQAFIVGPFGPGGAEVTELPTIA